MTEKLSDNACVATSVKSENIMLETGEIEYILKGYFKGYWN